MMKLSVFGKNLVNKKLKMTITIKRYLQWLPIIGYYYVLVLPYPYSLATYDNKVVYYFSAIYHSIVTWMVIFIFILQYS